MSRGLVQFFCLLFSTALGQRQKPLLIESENCAVSDARDNGRRLPIRNLCSLGPGSFLRPGKALRINAFNHFLFEPGNAPQRPARPQGFAQVVNQVEKDTEANQTGISG